MDKSSPLLGIETAHGRLYCHRIYGGQQRQVQNNRSAAISTMVTLRAQIVHRNLAFEMSLGVIRINWDLTDFFLLYSDLICKLILGLQLEKNYKHRKYISSFILAYLHIT